MANSDRRAQRKAKRRQERLRQEKHARRCGPGRSIPNGIYRPAIPSFHCNVHHVPGGTMLGTERSQRTMAYALTHHQPTEPGKVWDQVNASFRGDGGEGWHRKMLLAEPREQAQEYAYQALEAYDRGDVAACRRLARAALAIDDQCCDAHLALAKGERNLGLRIEILDAAIASEAERLGGTPYFEKHVGRCWRLIGTRPYMRARFHRLLALKASGEFSDAADEAEGLLGLNEDDAQAVRYHQLACLIAAGEVECAAEAVEIHRNEDDAAWCWAQVLERVVAGALDEALRALTRARQANPWVPALILAERRPACPPQYQSGDASEAAYIADVFACAWDAHPGSLTWLRGNA